MVKGNGSKTSKKPTYRFKKVPDGLTTRPMASALEESPSEMATSNLLNESTGLLSGKRNSEAV